MVWLSLLQPDGTSALQGWVGLHLQEGPGSKLNPPLSHRTGPLGRATSLPQEAGLRKRGRWASHLDSPPRPAPVRLRWLQCLNRTGTWGLGPHWSNSWQQKVTSELQNMPEASFKGGKERLNTDRDVRGDLKMRICTASPPVEVLTRGGPATAGQSCFTQARLPVLTQPVPGLVRAEPSWMETWWIPKKNSTNLNSDSKCDWVPLVFYVPRHLSL